MSAPSELAEAPLARARRVAGLALLAVQLVVVLGGVLRGRVRLWAPLERPRWYRVVDREGAPIDPDTLRTRYGLFNPQRRGDARLELNDVEDIVRVLEANTARTPADARVVACLEELEGPDGPVRTRRCLPAEASHE